ncbi:squalene/phytoene synthase family protein [uncultured Paracoccus sp.]|uniref:squalene/phytoene synthase family protein n=1 Tax=uncultured Paracoccus sp. TaxID=189685 RepID=UPI0025F55BDC|nr:squalene/phytoene synthase family protein [uncultured Paracoccus sp.]
MSDPLAPIAEGLRESDPDRFGASLILPPDARGRIWTLYALNNELARAPLQANEPLIAEMRLQWWADQLDRIGRGDVSAHDLLGPLAEAWGDDAAVLVDLVEARRRDCYREPFSQVEDVLAYVRATSGALMRHAVLTLGAPSGADGPAQDHALGTGLAHWLAALPQLDALGMGLARPDPALLSELAGQGLQALGRARAARRQVPRRIAPVLFRGIGHTAALREIAASGKPAPIAASEFRRRFALGRLALTGRWWE